MNWSKAASLYARPWIVIGIEIDFINIDQSLKFTYETSFLAIVFFFNCQNILSITGICMVGSKSLL